MAEAPALGYSIVANLGGDRQITVQCFVASDEALSSINDKIDRALAVVDRQKARYELVDLRAEYDKVAKTYSQFKEDYARIEADYAASQATLDEDLTKALALYDDEYQSGYNAHVESGRRGEYKPTGHRQSALLAIKGHQEKLKEARAKNEAERAAAVQNVEISIRRYEDEIARLAARISECEDKLKD